MYPGLTSDRAVEHAQRLARPFTEQEVMQQAWDACLDLSLSIDPRFKVAKEDSPRLWALAENV